MTNDDIWNSDAVVADLLNCEVPAWIDQDISASTIASICQGGCASGAYMPAVTYHSALRTMGDHGDDVLQYILDTLCELPKPSPHDGWAQMACHYLSTAVELWADGIMGQLEEYEPEDESAVS